jgi:hypothetical protein
MQENCAIPVQFGAVQRFAAEEKEVALGAAECIRRSEGFVCRTMQRRGRSAACSGVGVGIGIIVAFAEAIVVAYDIQERCGGLKLKVLSLSFVCPFELYTTTTTQNN